MSLKYPLTLLLIHSLIQSIYHLITTEKGNGDEDSKVQNERHNKGMNRIKWKQRQVIKSVTSRNHVSEVCHMTTYE